MFYLAVKKRVLVFVGGFCEGFISGLAAPYVVPTIIRDVREDERDIGECHSADELLGAVPGLTVGLALSVGSIAFSVYAAYKGSYEVLSIPLVLTQSPEL